MIAETDPRPWTAVHSAAEAPDEDGEEAAWVARARSGEQAAFAWLLSRYRARAVRLATHVLRRTGEAEDAAQEAFIQAFRNLHKFRGDGKFYTWLYQIVVRCCLDRRRLARWQAELPADETLFASDGPQDRRDADLTVKRILVESLLDRLSPPMRAALVLRELEGLDYEEIATVLKIPVGTVRSRLNTARSQFKRMYEAVAQETDHV
jgi:RNA polymerase sigma-70 factor, ECF subfamily